MKSMRSLLLLSLAAVAFLMAGPAAKADTNFDNPRRTLSEQQCSTETLAFTATVMNLDSINTVYLNGDAFNLDSPLTLDDSGFWTSAPLSLGPSASSGDFELFTVYVPLGTAEWSVHWDVPDSGRDRSFGPRRK